MDWAMEIADWKGFPQRRREARKRGKLLGLGLANYVESSIGAPKEQAQIHVLPEGRVDVVIGTQPSGQGHETSFAQVVSDLLEVPVEKVKIVLGDTDVVKVGGGSHSGRSMRHAGDGVFEGRRDLIDKGKNIAAPVLDVSPETIEFTDGRFVARDTNRSFDLLETGAERNRRTRHSRCPRSCRTDYAPSSPTTRCTSRFSQWAARLRGRDRSRYRCYRADALCFDR